MVRRRRNGEVRGVMGVLIVAADRMEFRGMPARRDWILRAGGVGARCAAAAVDRAVKECRPDAVVSTGFCGALDPHLDIGDVVVATAVAGSGRRYPALEPVCKKSPHSGVVASIDHVAETAAEKAALYAEGAIAVEMEAAGVAERAEAYGLPFFCIRAVTDLASEDMANDFNSALRPDGHFATIDILSSSLRQPLTRIPELIRLRKRCARAAMLLGEFIADCRF
jgi:adenosylhomocysteine nucleosidase